MTWLSSSDSCDDHVEVHGYGITDKAAVVAGVRIPSCVVRTYFSWAIHRCKDLRRLCASDYRAEAGHALWRSESPESGVGDFSLYEAGGPMGKCHVSAYPTVGI